MYPARSRIDVASRSRKRGASDARRGLKLHKMYSRKLALLTTKKCLSCSSYLLLRRNAFFEFHKETPAWYLSILRRKEETRLIEVNAKRCINYSDIKIPSSVREVTYGVKVTRWLINHDDLIFLSLPDGFSAFINVSIIHKCFIFALFRRVIIVRGIRIVWDVLTREQAGARRRVIHAGIISRLWLT